LTIGRAFNRCALAILTNSTVFSEFCKSTDKRAEPGRIVCSRTAVADSRMAVSFVNLSILGLANQTNEFRDCLIWPRNTARRCVATLAACRAVIVSVCSVAERHIQDVIEPFS
jgi:hypothetical protein